MAHTLSASEQLAHCTVRIEVESASGSIGTGTGFYYRFAEEADGRHVPAIVTNKHVVDGACRGRFYVTLMDSDGNPDYNNHQVFNFQDFERRWIPHPDPGIDLCAMPIAPLLMAAQQDGNKLFYVSLEKGLIPSEAELVDMTAMEDVVMIGYPNGIWDQVHNMPVMRRGVTATHPALDWNGNSEFLIDAACFPGSSGSPVFLFNLGGYATKSGGMVIGPSRIKLLGILYAGPQHTVTGEIRIVKVPTIDKPVSVTTIPNNLGMIIQSKKLVELDAIFAEILKNETPPK